MAQRFPAAKKQRGQRHCRTCQTNKRIKITTRDHSLFVDGKRWTDRQSSPLYRLVARNNTSSLAAPHNKEAFIPTENFHQETLEGRNLYLDSSLSQLPLKVPHAITGKWPFYFSFGAFLKCRIMHFGVRWLAGSRFLAVFSFGGGTDRGSWFPSSQQRKNKRKKSQKRSPSRSPPRITSHSLKRRTFNGFKWLKPGGKTLGHGIIPILRRLDRF